MHSLGKRVVIIITFCSAAYGWNYRLDGPAYWVSDGYTECGGSNQSPINIDSASTHGNPELRVLYEKDYNSSFYVDISVFNTGTNVQAVPLTGVFQVVAPCAWAKSYFKLWTLQQFHWHWGGSNVIGSEHTLDNFRYPMEMHLVHYNAAYGNFSEASGHPNGLMVLAFFFDTTPDVKENSNFQKVVDALPHITHAGQNKTQTSFNLYELVENSSKGKFYYYKGSLTTPGCGEVVTWIVYDIPILVSELQIDAFRDLYFAEDLSSPSEMVDNFRPIQGLNGRVIYINQENSNGATGRLSKVNKMLAIWALVVAISFFG